MIYSISDLHLDYTKKKTMELFGNGWTNYEDRIFENWINVINDEDVVLIPGDISWAMGEVDAKIDLSRIDSLPGKKIMIKGNHDYWWNSIGKIRKWGFNSIDFLQNDSVIVSGYNIAGTRGWEPRDSTDFNQDDEKIFQRELIRLRLSLDSVKNNKEIIVMVHYPPFNRDGRPNEVVEIIKDYNVNTCIYGHLHGLGLSIVKEGTFEGIEFHCTSSDYLQFIPKLIKG